KPIEVDDEHKLRRFYEKRMATEVAADALGEEWKGYVVRISGGNDKQGFPMKQGVLTHGRFCCTPLSALSGLRHRIKTVVSGEPKENYLEADALCAKGRRRKAFYGTFWYLLKNMKEANCLTRAPTAEGDTGTAVPSKATGLPLYFPIVKLGNVFFGGRSDLERINPSLWESDSLIWVLLLL
ncbi:hypothetical protein A6R68_01236, partial [Neotoma lepida]